MASVKTPEWLCPIWPYLELWTMPFYDRLRYQKPSARRNPKGLSSFQKISPDINKGPSAEDFKLGSSKYKDFEWRPKRTFTDQYVVLRKRQWVDLIGPVDFGGFNGTVMDWWFEECFLKFLQRKRFFAQSDALHKEWSQYRVEFGLWRSIFGTEKEVKYHLEAGCRTCNGSGARSQDKSILVDAVVALVSLTIEPQTPLGMMRRQVTCDVCHGQERNQISMPDLSWNRSWNKLLAYSSENPLLVWKQVKQIRITGQGEAEAQQWTLWGLVVVSAVGG